MYELVIIWADMEEQVFTYRTEKEAEKRVRGMLMALGEQIAHWYVRQKWRL